MNIIIDCFKLIKGVGKSNGIYNLTLNLVKNLTAEKEKTTDPDILSCTITVLGNRHNENDFNIDGVVFEEVKKYNPLKKIDCILWELFKVTKYCKRLKADAVVFPRGFCALFHPVKDIVIIHDMIPFYYKINHPKFFGKFENFYITNRLKNSAKKCSRVITISEESKREIIKYSKIKDEKITVIYNGCNEVSCSNELLSEPYISAITSKLPHKNAYGIAKSYEYYFDLVNNPYKLKIIGIENSDLDKFDLKQEVKANIECIKYIDKADDLYAIVKNSKLFVFLSLVEGFGFPPLEAMQLGVPVVCSNASSLPEVVEGASILVNPMNFYEVGQAIKDTLESPELCDKLINRGYENTKRFSWDKIAKQYWNVLLNRL